MNYLIKLKINELPIKEKPLYYYAFEDIIYSVNEIYNTDFKLSSLTKKQKEEFYDWSLDFIYENASLIIGYNGHALRPVKDKLEQYRQKN